MQAMARDILSQRGRIVMALCIAALCCSHARAQSIRAELSQSTAVVSEPVMLRIIVAGADADSQPAFSPIKDVSIRPVGRPSMNRMEVNGQVVRSDVTHHFEVNARAAGRYTLPAFTIDIDGRQYTSNRPTLTVTASPVTGPLFLTEVFSPREKAYVGQPITVTLQLVVQKYQKSDFTLTAEQMWTLWRQYGAAESSLGVFSQGDYNRPTVSEEQRVDERGVPFDYFVYRIDLSVVPTQSGPFDFGQIEIAYNYPVAFQRDIFGSVSMNRARRLRETPKLPDLTILPIPNEGRPADYNGAVGRYRISAAAKPLSVPVGDPITLSLRIRGNGSLEALSAPRLDRVDALTRDFEIPSDSLAGSVMGAEKVFTQTIRAKRDDVREIPAIPFSFFDPDSGKFFTAKSDPIPIKVRPTGLLERMTPPAAGAATPAPLAALADGLEANEDDTARLLADQRTGIGPVTWVVLIGMPIVYLVVSIIQARSARFQNDVALRRRSGALGKARKLLRQPDAESARAAVLGYIADCFNVPAGGLTRADAVRLLSERHVPASTIQTVDSFLTRVEQISYGGATGGGDSLSGMAGSVLDVLESAGIR